MVICNYLHLLHPYLGHNVLEELLVNPITMNRWSIVRLGQHLNFEFAIILVYASLSSTFLVNFAHAWVCMCDPVLLFMM